MSRRTVSDDRVIRLAEDALFTAGDVKVFISKEQRLVRYLGGLDEADKLELAHAQADVEAAVVRLRAAKGALAEVERRCAQKREIRTQIIADFNLELKEVEDVSRVIALDAAAVGVKEIRPELLNGCSPAEKARI